MSIKGDDIAGTVLGEEPELLDRVRSRGTGAPREGWVRKQRTSRRRRGRLERALSSFDGRQAAKNAAFYAVSLLLSAGLAYYCVR